MKLVEHSGNIGWKVHELAWNLHEIEFALFGDFFTKEDFCTKDFLEISNHFHYHIWTFLMY